MTNAVNQIATFEPIHAAHAIEQVALIVKFDRPLDDAVFLNIREVSKQFEVELPGKNELQTMSIAIGMLPGQQLPQSNLSTGFTLRRVSPDGSLDTELRIERTSLTFLTTRYTRWDALKNQAYIYFDVLLPIYLTQAALSVVSMNYIDKFAWSGDLADFSPNSLLRADSKYICRHIFETNDYWHSHTGLFIRMNDLIKRLLNINIDHIDEVRPEGTRGIISITTVLADHFNQPQYNVYGGSLDESIAMIKDRMQDMHNFGKSVLIDLLTEQMSQRIALVG